MRSLFWFGCAVLVCAASFVYLAADFVSRHPDSLAARCTRTAHAMSVQCNPLTALTSAGAHAVRTASELMWKALTVANEAPKPDGCTHACRTPPTCKASQPVEVIDLTLVPEPCGKSEGGQEESEAPPSAPNPDQAADKPQAVTVPPSAIEESTEVPSTMPPAEDNEQVPASPTMEDLVREQIDATRQHVFELWFDLFQKEVHNIDATGIEPPTDEAADSPADGSKDEPKSEEAEELGAQEESETVAPDCQVDPNYHKQYPGCPYMGGDPASHHCPPPMNGPAPMHHRKKVKASPVVDPKPDVEEAEASPADALVPFPMDRQPAGERPRNLGPTPDEDMPHHPEVDTMEFRKSDAKEGEFDSPPF